MAEMADFYDEGRSAIVELVSSLPHRDLDRSLPAAPAWSIKDVIGHLSGEVVCSLAGDYPGRFFTQFGMDDAVKALNEWTQAQVDARRTWSLQDVVNEWEDAAKMLTSMMRGDTPWPEGAAQFADRIFVTDLTVHRHDIYGALGIVGDRDTVPIKIGCSGYIAGMGLRISGAGLPPVRIAVGDKSWTAPEGDPAATVSIDSRFELFRALSGRRNPDQIRAYDWDGDPEPYIPYFYPYGIRKDALVE